MFNIETIHSQLVDQDYDGYKLVRDACKAEHIASGRKQSTFKEKWHFIIAEIKDTYGYTRPVQRVGLFNERSKALRKQIREAKNI